MNKDFDTPPDTQRSSEAPMTRPVSRTWIVIGGLALLLGLLMGFMMSSLGK